VAEEGSFGRAAVRLGFTQSAISQQIAALERIVGEPVFERPGGPRPVTLTAAGELLLPHALAVLDRITSAEAELAAYRAGAAGPLTIGTFQSVSVRILPELLTSLQQERPGVQVRLFESDDQEELIAKLRSGDLDVTFAVAPVVSEDELDITHLCTDPFVLLCPRGSPIVPPTGPVPVERLEDVELIGQRPTACQLLIEEGLEARGVRPNVTFRSSDNAAVQAMVRAGMGHAVMPSLAVDASDPGVDLRELDPPIEPRRIVMVTVPARALPPSVGVLRALALDHCGEPALRP
jgi:DNA-binding transcriptional LysR family regulator